MGGREGGEGRGENSNKFTTETAPRGCYSTGSTCTLKIVIGSLVSTKIISRRTTQHFSPSWAFIRGRALFRKFLFLFTGSN